MTIHGLVGALLLLICVSLAQDSDVPSNYGLFDNIPASMSMCGYQRDHFVGLRIPAIVDPSGFGFVTRETIECVLIAQYGQGATIPLNMFEACDHDGDGRWSFLPTNELLPSTSQDQCRSPSDCCMMNCSAMSAYFALLSASEGTYIACSTHHSVPSPTPYLADLS
jgi:hypothetical protein